MKYTQNMFSLLKTKIKTVLGRWLCQCFILYCLWKNISIISQPSVPTREREGLETLTVTIQGHKSTKWLRFNHKIIEHLPPPCLTPTWLSYNTRGPQIKELQEVDALWEGRVLREKAKGNRRDKEVHYREIWSHLILQGSNGENIPHARTQKMILLERIKRKFRNQKHANRNEECLWWAHQ